MIGWILGFLFVVVSAIAGHAWVRGDREDARRVSASFLPTAWGVLLIFGAFAVFGGAIWLAGQAFRMVFRS